MGIKRIVDTSFWTDGKVDEFSPEDKYFMLYLLTNPFSTQLGIYEISIKQVAFQLGYSVDTVKVLIDRFENNYNVILFSPETNEIAIKNFLQHSIIKGGAPVRDCLIKEMKSVKAKRLIAEVFAHLQKKSTYEEAVNSTVRNIITDFWETGCDISYYNEKRNDTWTIRGQNADNENENENENDNDNVYDSDESESPPPVKNDYQQIVDLYHSICKSLPAVRSLSDARKKAIKARLRQYTIEDFKAVFENAEASSFLTGADGVWKASFDWLIKEANMLKVLEGNYADKPRKGKKEVVPDWMNKDRYGEDDNYTERLDKLIKHYNTAGNNPEIAARAEALRQELGGDCNG